MSIEMADEQRSVLITEHLEKSTLRQKTGYASDWIECQLSHIDDMCHNDTQHATNSALGRIIYGSASERPRIEEGVPTLYLKMYNEAYAGFTETWFSTCGEVISGSINNLVYAYNDEFLFCSGFIQASGQYAEATFSAYNDAFKLINELNFPKIFRMWNFIPGINSNNQAGLEVYRDFCCGRAEAFELSYAANWGMPAATGIGTLGNDICFYFVACRESSMTHIENSRQMPAYQYPLRYGPKSPSFARATNLSAKKPDFPCSTFFVSGTASILDHETVHAGDIDKQCEITLSNIAYLLSAENLNAQGIFNNYTLHDIDQIKVYYRHAKDLSAIARICQKEFHPDASIHYMQVDICRSDLLVEIEGIVVNRNQ